MTRCQYCRQEVDDLGDHYGGVGCKPCPDVLYAFGPEERKNRARHQVQLLPNENAPRGKYKKGVTMRERLTKVVAKRRAPKHAGVAL